ncbi:glutamyl-tRNA(Gln) amidotransferase subunit A, mitochondrial-like isoform X1 [Planococcus citri]|uniref:glutamyl-tRNA(Gln) amidotransferase subunit A, mitochondrial-like isoform X1 n=1 Tax=Planococcus citri TaxID=170843 RepID=UPI0031F90520
MAFVSKTVLNSSTDHCRQCLERVKQTPAVNAFVTLLKDKALDAAAESDERISNGKRLSNLDGLTIGVKDNFCVKNVKTTCSSKMLQNFIAPYDATVVKRLKQAGGVILGKTNLDEFAMGSGTTDSIHGPTKNVWGSPLQYDVNRTQSIEDFNEWRIAGGSSGGSAVAVATGSVFAALGSDTGGSTRNPASYCGVIGYKPTYGVVSRNGLIPLVNSMDVPGILARTVNDTADVFNIISGPDCFDSTTVEENTKPVNLNEEFDINNVKIGIPREYHNSAITPEILETWKYIANIFQNAGATVQEMSMPHTEHSIVTYSILNACEVASNMSRYSGLLFGHRSQAQVSTDQVIAESRCEGFGPVVRSRILAGNYFLLQRNYEKYFVKAMKVRRLIADDFENAWNSGFNFLLTPTTLSTAPLLSDFTKLDNRSQCALQDYCTQAVNMAGCPAISIPIYLSKEGLPISLQVIGRNFEDAALLQLAGWLEKAVSFPHLVS